MQLTLNGIQKKEDWKAANIALPSYDIEKIRKNTKENPVWVHFGAGNIFRIFMGGLTDTLLSMGEMQTGITCVETFDFDVIDKIYKPFDNLVLAITLNTDGSTDKKVLGSLAEAYKASPDFPQDWHRLEEIFINPSLQMVSFTITEKGYALKGSGSAISLVCALLYKRYEANQAPIALVSMDNCSHNGEKLQKAVLDTAKEWQEKGSVTEGFLSYLCDENQVSFPWSMIDKITPRPAQSVYKALKHSGVENIEPIITSKKTYIAPFVNAEAPQYLVIEDNFPNGRPPLEKAGVYLTDRDTVNKVERMKVTTCLNPLHTALAVYGCLLGYTSIADEMNDRELKKLICEIGPVEGMSVVTNPGILSPSAFVDEVIHVRFPNPFMPDTPQRIATDTSQKVGIRYGETIKAYVEKYGTASKLTAIPLAIAGWCRYLIGIDDEGNPFELSPDPMLPKLTQSLKGIEIGNSLSYTGQLKAILSDTSIFGINLYEAGIGEKIEEMFLEEIAEFGGVRSTLKKYLNTEKAF
ncbi:MAG: mannitol dehydrogenase family protein [Bacillota bacterium]|nr:mannitol dehydrogenase family protein [Bacillota bacterium]